MPDEQLTENKSLLETYVNIISDDKLMNSEKNEIIMLRIIEYFRLHPRQN